MPVNRPMGIMMTLVKAGDAHSMFRVQLREGAPALPYAKVAQRPGSGGALPPAGPTHNLRGEGPAGGRDLAWNLLLGAAPSLFAVPTLVRMPGIYLWTLGSVYPA